MQPYLNVNHDSGVAGYDTGPSFIRVQFAREILVNRQELQRAVDAGRVFTVVISCPANGGQVDISASGGRKVRDEILTIFGRSMDDDLDLVVDPDAPTGRYELNHLRRRRVLAFDRAVVEDARIRSVRFRVIGGGRRSLEVKADPNEDALDIYEVLDHWFDRERVPPTNIDLQSVTFAVRLPHAGGRQPCFSFYATKNGSSNVRALKDAYEYDLCPTNLVAVDCRGDPEHTDDRSVVQIAQNNPPQAGLVFPTWFWFDWVRSTASATAYYNKSLATKAPSAYCGQQVRAGVERPALAVTGLASNGGSYHTALTDVVLAAPGSATKGTLDCPLIAEDGSAPAPQPLRVPCWVGRWGFTGATGQVLAGGTSTQNLGFILKLKPLSLPFTENAAALKIEFAAQTAEYGCEVFGACSYTMVFVQNPATYSDMNFSLPGPPYPCKTYGDRCWKHIDLGAYIQVFLTPLGNAWQAIVAIHQLRAERQASSGRYVLYSNFSPGFYHQKGSLSLTKLADDVSATSVGIGTTTTVTRNLFGGEASLTVEIAVSAIGKVTKCEARITRNATVTNLGPGWHDKFVKL